MRETTKGDASRTLTLQEWFKLQYFPYHTKGNELDILQKICKGMEVQPFHNFITMKSDKLIQLDSTVCEAHSGCGAGHSPTRKFSNLP